MKVLAIILLSIVGTLMLNGPIQSYADPQLDTLVNIAIQARNNLNINISQITNVPIEIIQIYKQGSDETDALTKAANQQNITSAEQHFLSAMKFFKSTNDKINSLNTTEANDQQRTNVIKLQSEITRIEQIGERLRTVAITNHADFNFTQFDQSIQKAKQDLDNGKVDDALKSIEISNQFMIDAHHFLATIAEKRTTDRAKDFTEKQIETLNKTGDLNISKNPVIQTPKIASMPVTSNNVTSEENPMEMITKIRKLISEGNVDEALKVMKSLKTYQNEKSKTSESLPQISTNMQNNTEVTVNPNAITPPSNITISNPIKLDSSYSNHSKTNSSMKTNKTESKVIPHGNIGTEQQSKVKKDKNPEKKYFEKQPSKKGNPKDNSQSKNGHE
jgi:soluble cytochrome b562